MQPLKRIMHLPWRPLKARMRRARFDAVCKKCGLDLDYATNAAGLRILEEVFVDRIYADYFPFYQRNAVLDVGGHFGYFAIFAARNSAPGSRIVTVEPSAHNLGVLRSNIDRLQLNQIHPIHGAVSDTTGTASVHITRDYNCSLFAEHAQGFSNQGALPTETVPTFSLSDVLSQNNLESVDVLKLDCEGAEYAIIEHSPKAVLQRIRVIMMEFHDLKDPRRTGLSMIDQLGSKGFRAVHFHHLPTNMDLNYGKIIAVRA